jgi:hypothetical protein
MALWLMDIVGGVFLADGTECKVVTGVDDHSRFCVIALALSGPSAAASAPSLRLNGEPIGGSHVAGGQRRGAANPR